MAELSFKCTCGCGYVTKKAEEATRHSDSAGHKMDIRGEIKPSQRNHNNHRGRISAKHSEDFSGAKAITPNSATVHEDQIHEFDEKFNALRKKISSAKGLIKKS